MNWVQEKYWNPVVVSIFVFIGGYYLLIDNTLEAHKDLVKHEDDLKYIFEHKQRMLVNKGPLIQQVIELDRMLDEFHLKLPDVINTKTKRNEIIHLADNYNINIEKLEFKPAEVKEYYSKLPFQLQVSGELKDMYYYFFDVFYNSGMAMRLRDFSIQSKSDSDKQILNIQGNLYFSLKDK